MARIINQNNEVIATKNNNSKGVKKATVSKTSFIVGLALAIAAIAIIIVVILFATRKDKDNDKKTKTPLLQYIDNYSNTSPINPKIKVLSSTYISFELGENYNGGESYILIYDVDWMTKNEIDSDVYKSFARLDAYLTGKPYEVDGETRTFDEPLLKALENCGQDIKFYVVDLNSIAKKEEELKQNPEYFKLAGYISMQNLKSPMLFHYVPTETYTSMNDTDLILADGNTKAGQWGSIIKGQVNYINSIDNNNEED